MIDWRLVSDGTFSAPAAMPLASAPPEERERALAGSIDAEGNIVSPCNCLLVSAGGRLALVDTGLGDVSPQTGRLHESLASAGVTAADIDIVVVSHAHPDHIGGLTAAGEPVFARAEHYVARAEWEFWTSPGVLGAMSHQMAAPARAHLPPLEASGRLRLIDEETEVLPGVRLLPAPGHTPGHLVVELTGGDEPALYLADAVLHEVGVEHPEWTGMMDVDAVRAVATRLDLLERAAGRGLVAAYHLAGPGRVERTPGGYRFRPAP